MPLPTQPNLEVVRRREEKVAAWRLKEEQKAVGGQTATFKKEFNRETKAATDEMEENENYEETSTDYFMDSEGEDNDETFPTKVKNKIDEEKYQITEIDKNVQNEENSVKSELEEDSVKMERDSTEHSEDEVMEDTIKIEQIESEDDSSVNQDGSFVDQEIEDDVKTETVESKVESKPEAESICLSCDKTFTSSKHLADHLKKVHSKQLLDCPVCSSQAKHLGGLRQHMKRQHKLDSQEIAEKLRAVRVRDRTVYQDTHKSQLEVVCPECNKVFKGKYNLRHHIENWHKSGDHLCNVCGDEFDLKGKLKNHHAAHHGKDHSGVCPICSKEMKNLKSHMKDVHTVEKQICPHCARTFNHKKHLTAHITTAHSDPSKAMTCPYCSKLCKNPVYYRQHVRLVHETVNNLSTYVSCQECGKEFANKANLHSHVQAVHVVDTKICKVCGRSYKNKMALGKHMKNAHDGHPVMLQSLSERAVESEEGRFDRSPMCRLTP